MDISKFNKELADKITEAKILEKRGEFNSAVKVWLKISEMTLNASKTRDIEVSYKNMLINKTQEIIAHIKDLKSIDKPTKTALIHSPGLISKNELSAKSIVSPKVDFDQNTEKKNNDLESNHSNENNTNSEGVKGSGEIDIPEGFKEISPVKDFKIITPHNPNYVKDAIDRAQKQPPFKKQEKSTSPTDNAERNIICFACGYDKNPRDKKVCQNCGTKL